MITQDDILAMAEDNVVLLDFWAPWCGPCKTLAPHLDKLQEKYGEHLKVLKVNADENGDLANFYGVMGLPTMLLLKGQAILDRRQGAMAEVTLQSWVNSYLPN